MARTRSIKPTFFLNDQLATLPYEWRLLFIGLWTQADRNGRLEDRPLRLKAALFPYDTIDLAPGLASLEALGLITRYVVDRVPIIAIPKWEKHQNPHPGEPGIYAVNPRAVKTNGESMMDHGESVIDPSLTGTSTGTGTSTSTDPFVLDPGTGTDPLPRSALRAAESEDATLVGRFEIFWRHYPRKQGRGAALRRWERLKPTDALLERMLAAITEQKQSYEWLKESGQFIPHPATWLHQQRWLDEGVEVPAAGQAGVSDTTRKNLAARDAAISRLRSVK